MRFFFAFDDLEDRFTIEILRFLTDSFLTVSM